MTPLCEQMSTQPGFSVRTHKSYLAPVSDLARFHGRSPAELKVADLQASTMWRKSASCLVASCGIDIVLGR